MKHANLPAHTARSIRSIALATALLAAAASSVGPAARAASEAEARTWQRATPVDRSGQPRTGEASYYHRMFDGRRMANGKPFDADGANAASRSLPLGTVARVTNLANGRSAVVRIEDRGPYVDGRIVDLSPATAEALDFLREGVAPVQVTPLRLPPPPDERPSVALR